MHTHKHKTTRCIVHICTGFAGARHIHMHTIADKKTELFHLVSPPPTGGGCCPTLSSARSYTATAALRAYREPRELRVMRMRSASCGPQIDPLARRPIRVGTADTDDARAEPQQGV